MLMLLLGSDCQIISANFKNELLWPYHIRVVRARVVIVAGLVRYVRQVHNLTLHARELRRQRMPMAGLLRNRLLQDLIG